LIGQCCIFRDPQNDSLSDGVGLTKRPQPLSELGLWRLSDLFTALETQIDEVKPMIEKKTKVCPNVLKEQ
jgi:hypothetical protein